MTDGIWDIPLPAAQNKMTQQCPTWLDMTYDFWLCMSTADTD
jgi:hypothetical protein